MCVSSFTICDWWNEPRSRDRQREADVFIEANKKWRERWAVSGSWMAKQFPPAKTRPLNPCCTGSDIVKRFSLWWYLTCCYCLSFAAVGANDCAPTTMAVRQQVHTPLRSHIFVSQVEAKSKHFAVIQVIRCVRCHCKTGEKVKVTTIGRVAVCMHTNTLFLNSKCSRLFLQ